MRNSLLILFFGLISLHLQSFAQGLLEKEDYEVFATFINAEKGKTRVVIDETDTVSIKSGERRILARMPQLKRETIQSFKEKNLTSARITQGEFANKTTRVVSLEEIKPLVETFAGWKAFEKKIPQSDGFLIFGGVGYDRRKTQALVYLQHYCGVTCATGSYYFLKKVNHRWEIRASHTRWVL